MNSPTTKDKVVLHEFEMPTTVRVYSDGSVERIGGGPDTIPSPNPDPQTGVSSKDIIISPNNPPVPVRLYIPKLTPNNKKPLPIFVYFHGGGFITGSAFNSLYHRYLNILVAQAGIIAVSVEYRIAPENPLPAAYGDCWMALKWVASHSINNNWWASNGSREAEEPWLLKYGDFKRVFIGGDSSGGNIAHNIAMRAGGVEELKISGAVIGYPFLWGSKPIGSEETNNRENYWASVVWNMVYPMAPDGVDNVMINPFGLGKPSLASLGCSKVLLYIAEKEALRDREVLYGEAVKESGWRGEIEVFETKGEEHLFHILDPESENSKILIEKLVLFLNSC